MNSQELKALSLAQLVDHFAEVMQEENLPAGKYMDSIKYCYARKLEYIREKGTDEERELADIHAERYQDLQNRYDELSRKALEEREKIYEERREQMDALMHKFDASVSMSGANFDNLYEAYIHLAKAWETIGELDTKNFSQLSKRFEELRTRFYDLDGGEEQKQEDYAKNKSLKDAILEKIEAYAQSDKVAEASQKLQGLLKEWHYIGPVAKEDGAINKRLKELCHNINKRHNDFHTERISQEDMNYNLKVDVCIRFEELLTEEPKNAKSWREMKARVDELVKEYKEIPFCGGRKEKTVYERFSAARNVFYQRRSEHISKLNNDKEENLRLKQALVEEAKALSMSTDWDATVEEFKRLRKEWKKIGFVPREYMDSIWAEFNAASDIFFERLKTEGPRVQEKKKRLAQREEKTLEKKREIVAKLEELVASSEYGKAFTKAVGELSDAWRKLHVSRCKEGEELYKKYRALHNQLYNDRKEKSRGDQMSRYMDKFKKLEQDKDAWNKEFKLLCFLKDKMTADLNNRKNNQAFIDTNSDLGRQLLEQVQREERKMKEELDFVEERLKLFRAANKKK